MKEWWGRDVNRKNREEVNRRLKGFTGSTEVQRIDRRREEERTLGRG